MRPSFWTAAGCRARRARGGVDKGAEGKTPGNASSSCVPDVSRLSAGWSSGVFPSRASCL
ncbi:hypothetical protein ACFLQL_01715 [Verrucomicrobiota bacterium]